jgi:thioredoxin-related protein
MKRVLIIAITLLSVSAIAYAGNKKKKDAAKVPAIDTTKITWLTWDEAQLKMKKEPKKVFVDVYTDWCGWCKVMDRKTFSNKDMIKYMNTNFYSVKFNSEKDDNIMFLGRMYRIQPDNKTNELAIQLLNGQLSYPTVIFIEENFQNPVPVPGYHPVDEMEKIIKYLEGGLHKKNIKFEDFNQTFKASWVAEGT